MFHHIHTSTTASGETLRWLNLPDGKVRRKFFPPANPRNFQERIADHIAFSPDGRTLASAERDHTVVLYETASGLPRRVLAGHRNNVSRLAFTRDGRRLVTVSADLTGLVWDLSLASAGVRKRSKDEPAQAWSDLADCLDGGKVHRAMAMLAGDPHGAVVLLRAQLQPARAVDAKQLARLLADLDSDRFDVRSVAFAKLDEFGDAITGALRGQLKKNLSLEVRRRLQVLLEKHDPATLSSDRLRAIRAVELLEHLGTPPAVALLDRLAQGNPHASLTRAARAAVERLRRVAMGSSS